MRFLSIYKTRESSVPPTPEEMCRMGELVEEMTRAGVLLATEGCRPSASGARVRRAGDSYTVSDGPFTEAKELVGGFAIIQAGSKDEAIEHIRRFLQVAGEGECEIRQLYEAGDFAPGGCAEAGALAAHG